MDGGAPVDGRILGDRRNASPDASEPARPALARVVPLTPASPQPLHAPAEGPADYPVSHVRPLSVYGHLIALRRSAGGPTKVAGGASAAVGAPARAVRRGGASVPPATRAPSP